MQKCKDLVIHLVAIFDVSVVALNLFLILSFAFSTEVSKLLPPVAAEENRTFANPACGCDLQAEHVGIKRNITQNELP